MVIAVKNKSFETTLQQKKEEALFSFWSAITLEKKKKLK